MLLKCPHCNEYISLVVKKPISKATGFFHPNPEYSIEWLHLSVRARNALINEGYDTIGKVLQALNDQGEQPHNALMRLPNFGKVSFAEVCDKLRMNREERGT